MVAYRRVLAELFVCSADGEVGVRWVEREHEREKEKEREREREKKKKRREQERVWVRDVSAIHGTKHQSTIEEQGQNRKYAGEVTALPTESPLLQRYLVHKNTPPP